jgi:hypothetical protein
MTRALLRASWLAVRRAPLLAPCLAAVVLVIFTWPWQDEGRAVEMMHGLAVLLACAWAGTTDDPTGEVAAATPYPARIRVAARLLVGLTLVLPLYLAGAIIADVRFEPAPIAALVVEAVGYAMAAVAIGSALRARFDVLAPAYAASIGLLGFAFATYPLADWWTMVEPQTWGPPWTAALIRWAAVTLLAVGVLCDALRDRGAPARATPSSRPAPVDEQRPAPLVLTRWGYRP